MAQFASAHTVQQHQHGLEFLPPWYRVTSSQSFCHIFTTKKGKKKKKWKQGEVAALLFFFFFWNNKQPKAQRGNLKEKKNVEKHNDKPRLCGEPYLRRCIWFEPHSLELFVGGGGGTILEREPPCGVLGAPWLSQDPRGPSIWTRSTSRVMFHLSLP